MADRTLTINHADGGSETYTINRDKFAGVRALTIDGDNVSIYHTAVLKEQAKETTFGGSNNITVNRDVEPLLKDVVGGAAVAYSLRDLNDTLSNNKVVKVRRASDGSLRDFSSKELKNGYIEEWVKDSPLPLEIASGAAAAYSLRNLRGDYTGYVVDIRRSSDNETKGFTADELKNGIVESWVGNNNDGFVSRWYDQSGNNNNVVQTDPTKQPKIVQAGNYLDELDFDGSQAFEKLTAGSVITSLQNTFTTAVATRRNNSSGYISQISDGSNRLFFRFSDLTVGNPSDNISVGASNNVEHLLTLEGSAGSYTGYLNGSSIGTASTDETGVGSFAIGSNTFNSGAFFDGTIKEFIIYDTDQSASRQDIEDSLTFYYGLTNIPTPSFSSDGFVHTWYDQSGNNKDSIQTDPTKQPKLVSEGRYLGELDFDGTQCFSKITEGVLTSIQDVYVSCVSKRRNGNQGYIAQVSDGPNRLFINPRRTTIGTEATLVAYNNLDDVDTLTTLTAAQGTYNGYKDGVDVNDTETTVSSGAGQFTVGASSTEGAKLNGTIKEIIIYDSDQSANRLAIEANIKSALENPVDVFIMMGQSNMVGFNVGDWPPTSYLSGANDDKVWISSEAGTALNDQGDLTAAGYDTDGWIKLDEYAAQSRFGYGPNLDFARTLVNDYNYKSLGIIKWARNGTSIELSWKKSVNKFYPSLVSFLNQQISDLRTRVGGAGIRIAGFVWFQGHGDSAVQSRAEAYEANLTQLVADLRADVDSAATAQIIIARSPDFWKLPFEVGELEENAQRVINVDTIKTAQQNVAENDGNGLWVNTDDYDYRESWVSGVAGNRPVHLTTDAKQALGVRLANAVATQTNYTG